MKRAILLGGAVLAFGALALATAAPAFAWEQIIEGKPAALEAGGLDGAYFWHDPDGLHLETTDAQRAGHHYTGTLTTDGAFTAVQLVRPENDDSFTQPAPGILTFSFVTFSGIDGIQFHIDGGTQVTLDLQLDGHELPVDNIFLGAYSQHPKSNPFTVTRAGGGPPPPPPGDNPIIGKPKALEAGSTAGVYFWKADDLHIATTDPEGTEHHYSGTLVTDGTIVAVQPVKDESDDTFTVTGPHNDELDFDFHTFSGIDGVAFRVRGGSYAVLTLYRDGALLPIDHIFLGAYSQHPDSNPFTADIH
jgi:hypothetical protein